MVLGEGGPSVNASNTFMGSTSSSSRQHTSYLHPTIPALALASTAQCGKMYALEKLLVVWREAGDKVLLFSHSTRMLDLLEHMVTFKVGGVGGGGAVVWGRDTVQLKSPYNRTLKPRQTENQNLKLLKKGGGGQGVAVQSQCQDVGSFGTYGRIQGREGGGVAVRGRRRREEGPSSA